MDTNSSPALDLKLVGGALCLDFTNTVSQQDVAHGALRNDRLTGYPDLVWWGYHAGVLTEGEAQQLLAEAAAQPDAAAATLQTAKALRTVLFGLFSPDEEIGVRPEDLLTAFNAHLARTMPHARLIGQDGPILSWGWDQTALPLDRMLWDVVWSAADLLTSQERVHVHECAGETCTWLFVDGSKNHRRRWCRMDDCGNLAKARAFRSKRRNS